MKAFFHYLLVIIISLLIGTTLSKYVFSIVTVNGSSMQPTLQNDEHVMQYKLVAPHQNDVIVFDAKGVDPNVDSNIKHIDYVKRIIATPGDTVRYTKNGILFVNNKKVNQYYLSEQQSTVGTLSTMTHNYLDTGFDLNTLSKTQGWRNPVKNNKVPQGYYFVMGDNRAVSNDGRYWGLVPRLKITGVVYPFFWQHKF